MTLNVDVFWSFRSPYCYLAGPRLLALQSDYDLAFRLRPVLPIALRIEGFFKRQSPMAKAYFFRDIARVAEFLHLPLEWPTPDPVAMDMETGEVALEQPLIHRITRLGVFASRHGQGLAFAVALSRSVFGGSPGWDTGHRLAEAAASVGFNLADMEREIEDDPQTYAGEIEANQAAHAEAGHWGVPLMVFRREPFFGQDRIDLLLWRLRSAGLSPPSAS